MKTIKLSNRLMAIAELAGNSVCAADIGTDHAYVPIWLIQSKKAEHVIASDINADPLERAKKNAREHGIDLEIEFLLSDGIIHLKKDSAETIIIAGMGGETIADILSRADWLCGGEHRLVLQPMSKTTELVFWLYNNDLNIINARLAEDSGEIYIVLLVKAGKMNPLSEAGAIVPKCLFEKKDPLLKKYLDVNIEKVKNALSGIKNAKSISKIQRITELEKLLDELVEMRGAL